MCLHCIGLLSGYAVLNFSAIFSLNASISLPILSLVILA
jgi:hypothetical protein